MHAVRVVYLVLLLAGGVWMELDRAKKTGVDEKDDRKEFMDSEETDAMSDAGSPYYNSSLSMSASQFLHHPQEFQFVNPKPDDVVIECKPLRSKRFITDGFCTSLKAVEDVLCTGNCLPIRNLPWYAEFIKVWSRSKTLQYRCIDDVVRHRRVTLVCDNGETRTYRIPVVRSCKCKRYMRSQNQSPVSGKKKSSNGDKLSNLSGN